MFYRLLTSTLLTFSFWLTLTAASVGQGDFDPSYFQRAAVRSVTPQAKSGVSESKTVEPIGSSFFEPEQPLAQVSFSQTTSLPGAEYQPEYSPTIEQYDEAPEDFTGFDQAPENNWVAHQTAPTWTASIFGGPSFIDNQPGDDNRTLDSGGLLGFAVGRRFNSKWRSELELSWRGYEIDSQFLNLSPSISYVLGGNISTTTGMVNLYHDFDRGPSARLIPYIGFGLGASRTRIEDTLNGLDFSTGDGTAFAYQFMVGINCRIKDRTHFFIEYRPLRISTQEIDMFLNDFPDEASIGGYRIKGGSNDLVMGLRFEF